MARPLRQNSGTGIYHVMLRGINRQIIFECANDYRRFVDLLKQMTSSMDEHNKPLPPKCKIYAYCLMPNHVHLLIHEKSENLSMVIKRIAAAYAQYYNKKYERQGHLFQDRFKSEPVADVVYFFTLLRYIHQNPVAGGLCKCVDGYEWSSWWEYVNNKSFCPSVCSTSSVLKRMPREDLITIVNDPLPKTLRILDFDKNISTITDEEVSEFLIQTFGLQKPTDLQQYEKKRRNAILSKAKKYGASIRQLSRLTGISIGIIRKT